MPFVAPKSTTTASSAAPNAAGRTTFRPPWVKDEPASTVKTSVPWAKKTSTATAAADKAKEENGAEKPTLKKATSTTKKTETTKPAAEPAKKVTADPKKTVETSVKKTTAAAAAAEPAKKVIGTTKKAAEPAKKAPEPAKKAPEPVKKVVAPAKKTVEAVKTPAAGAAKKVVTKKKEPTPPPSSSEEEESEEEESEEEETEEEETEEEESEEEEEEVTDDSGEETDDSIREVLRKAAEDMKIQKALEAKKKQQQESELDKRFTLEKPKLRPVMVKRDKSTKNVNGDDDDENGDGETEEDRRLRFKLEKPKLRHVKREEKPLPAKSTENMLKFRPTLKKVSKIDEILKEPKEEPKPEFKTKTLRKTPSIKREPSIKNVPAPPPLPSLVPKAPPPPPPPLGPIGEKRELTPTQKAALDKLKTRPRRRPDWSEMMKEVESGKKLRHVECNDRSQPILTCKSMTKVDDKFIYETEKDKPHNKLLKQIQGGVKLKPTKTNDRSKPILDGLRKFRRQMTIEEQLQKSQSKINMLNEVRQKSQSNLSEAAGTSDAAADGDISNPLVAALILNDPSGDELDDIDKIRDDLQSTKQMLALELRNREAKERENKKLLAKIATLEAELEREKSREKNLEYGSNVIVATMDPTPAAEDIFVANLKKEAEEARKHSKELEKKYHDTGEQLDEAKAEIEEQRQQIKMLEKKLAQAMQGGSVGGSRRQSEAHLGRDSSPEFDLAMSESDPDEPEEKKAERRERRLGKEVKVLRSKLTKLKVKEETAKKEKVVLKQAIKKNHVILKEENKKFKKLEKEVHKMAASMKEDDDDDEEKDDEDEDEEEAAEEESEEEEDSDDESEESESEESGAETESESEAEDASNADKKANLEPRVKKHEGRLSAAKKCNVLLQANVDNIQDEISQVRSKASNLQAELDSVLADLGL